MSARNRRDEKKLRTLRRALRKGRLPAYIDLTQWLRDRNYCQTVGAARRMILAGHVKSESHPLGVAIREDDDGNKFRVFEPRVSAALRPTIRVDTA